jgi:UDP-N-acetylglucosamine--N-acetylmuramyl-(pentapeptide) pyrophosphoryl-undecaprenol N-acetylglucosamine transferase
LPESEGGKGRLAVIAAGGTGGHLFPAEALSRVLIDRGWRIALATDDRVDALAAGFPAERRIALSSATFARGDRLGFARAGLAMASGILQARSALRELDPSVVVGFGGYPSVPAVAAGILARRPTVIHEANAVLGRANRLLAPHVTAVACAFPLLAKASPKVQARAVRVGNPVRPQIAALSGLAYVAPTAEIRLLVTGGSQGARLLSELVPAAVAKLPEALRLRLRVAQQARPEFLDAARRAYAEAQVNAEVAPFFRDMGSRLAAAHLIIGRAGASTVSEIAVAGRPSILVPLGIALDDDQGRNAEVFAAAGAAEIAREEGLTREDMTTALEKLLSSPPRLTRMAKAARSLAHPDAAERLADLVETTASRESDSAAARS